MPFTEDLNQSSRLDLHYDPDNPDFDDSAFQMSHIAEQSYMTSASDLHDNEKEKKKNSHHSDSDNSDAASSAVLSNVMSRGSGSRSRSVRSASSSRGRRSVSSRSSAPSSTASSQSRSASKSSRSRSASRSSKSAASTRGGSSASRSRGGGKGRSRSRSRSKSLASSKSRASSASSAVVSAAPSSIEGTQEEDDDGGGEDNSISHNSSMGSSRDKSASISISAAGGAQSDDNSSNSSQSSQHKRDGKRKKDKKKSRQRSRSRTQSPHSDDASLDSRDVHSNQSSRSEEQKERDGRNRKKDKKKRQHRSRSRTQSPHPDDQSVDNDDVMSQNSSRKERQRNRRGDMNGYSSKGSSNGEKRGIEREGTHSTLDVSSSTQGDNEQFKLPNVDVLNKKLIKIKLWDLDDGVDSASAQPSIISVAMDALPIQELSNNEKEMNMEVGKKIQLQHNGELIVGNSDMGENTVDISWMPPSAILMEEEGKNEETWQSPFVLSNEDSERADTIKNKLHNPQPEPTEQKQLQPSSNRRRSASKQAPPSAAASIHSAAASTVKGLEPFTIPSIISSTVVKETPASKVGLAFRKANAAVVIEKIGPQSPFQGKNLKPGYECLSINGHRLRSARRAAEIVRNSTSLTVVASNAPRPPGTMYTMISPKDQSGSLSAGKDHAVGMHFKMKQGLIQLVKAHPDSPISSTSMRVGDFVLAINGLVLGDISKAVDALSDSTSDDMVPILYFNMRQLRVSLVDKVIGDLWKKDWTDGYNECILTSSSSKNPLILRFNEEGMSELLGHRKSSVIPSDHPLQSVVETLNHGIMCVLSAIREGVELVTKRERRYRK